MLDGTAITEADVFQAENDPVIRVLAQVVSSPRVKEMTAAALQRVTDALNAGTETMAWEVLPLTQFGGSLPAEIRSCWIFVIRPGQATGAERHPNSHQRSLSLQGSGRFELRQATVWEAYDLDSGLAAPVGKTWVTIPPNTWHRLFSEAVPWGMISFHTVPSSQLIEERPESEMKLDTGPTSSRVYAPDGLA
jgi:quercetin dioxygenase-like cupin family protein